MAAKGDEEEEGEKEEPERPQFNEEEFKIEFDSNNPEVLIPPEVPDEIDNDYDLPYTAPALQTE